MNKQGKCAGFCFRCAVQAPHSDTEVSPTHLQNPWPLLIQGDDLDSVTCCQPLIRTIYSPIPLTDIKNLQLKRRNTSRTKPTTEDINDFSKWFTYLHEYVHLMHLDWTPAKELARILVTRCYTYLYQLFSASSVRASEAAWKKLQACTSGINHIYENICFVEELIATSLALNVLETQVRPGEMWAGFQEALETLKEEALTNEEEQFPGFRAVYERIKPLSQIMLENSAFAAQIIPLLQPITTITDAANLSTLQTVNAQENLDVILALLENVKFLQNATFYTQWQWLNQLRNKQKHELQAWEKVVAGQLVWTLPTSGIDPRLGIFSQKLWDISKGNPTGAKLPRGTLLQKATTYTNKNTGRFYMAFTPWSPLGPGSVILLQREPDKRKNCIGIYFDNWSGTPLSQAVRNCHYDLVFYESIWQQLAAGEGFICPFHQGKLHCQCDPLTSKGLQKLAHLALDGVFGHGKWSAPPCLSLGCFTTQRPFQPYPLTLDGAPVPKEESVSPRPPQDWPHVSPHHKRNILC